MKFNGGMVIVVCVEVGLGEKETCAFTEGAENVTYPENPLIGFTVNVNWALLLGVTVCEVGVAEIVKSGAQGEPSDGTILARNVVAVPVVGAVA